MSKFDIFSAVDKLKSIVESKIFLESSRKVKTAFTRLRKMPFSDIIYFMIGSNRHCVQYELDQFLSQKGKKTMTRQAFAKSRENIKPGAIRQINEEIIAEFEQKDSEIKTLHNYRVFAVDGSVIDLPENQKLRDAFGYSTGTNDSSHCKARAMICFDVLNHICPYGELISFFKSETTHMHEISDCFSKIDAYKNSIFVLDRGYPSLKLFCKMEENNQKFLMRVSRSFYKEIVNAPNADQIITIKRKCKKTSVRVIKFTLPSGLEEILVTNLPDSFTYDELTNLYSKRWGVETTYHYIKNSQLLECFTGESVAAILQDFYISVLLMNFTAFTYREQEDVLDKKSTSKKYHYKSNVSNIIRYIKVNFMKMLCAKSKFTKIYRELFLYKNIIRYAYAQVEGRSKPRRDPKRHSTLKTHPKPTL